MNLPNAISLVRLLLVPVFAWLFLADRPMAALLVFVAAAASDGIDGFLARLLEQRTALGAILDPLADKALGIVALVLLVWAGALPGWFLVTALARDAVVFGMSLTTRIAHRPIRAAPTRVSKYATFLLMATVTLALLSLTPAWSEAGPFYLAAVGAVAAECLVVATVQYAALWRVLLRTEEIGGAKGSSN